MYLLGKGAKLQKSTKKIIRWTYPHRVHSYDIYYKLVSPTVAALAYLRAPLNSRDSTLYLRRTHGVIYSQHTRDIAEKLETQAKAGEDKEDNKENGPGE